MHVHNKAIVCFQTRTRSVKRSELSNIKQLAPVLKGACLSESILLLPTSCLLNSLGFSLFLIRITE